MPEKKYIFLIILIVANINFLFLIGKFQYEHYREQNLIKEYGKEFKKNSLEIQQLERYNLRLQTTAYHDQFGKQTQDKKNPGEDVMKINFEKDLLIYDEIDVNKEINTAKNSNTILSPTNGMNPQEKWIYYLFSKKRN